MCGTNQLPLTDKLMQCTYNSRIPPPDMVGKGEVGAPIFQGGGKNGFDNVLWHKTLRRVKIKRGLNTVVYTST